MVSDFKNVTYGVPQGSVLRPLFFLTYINDMSDAVENVHLSLYADDTVLYVSGEDIGACTQQIQENLNRFSRWCQLNALKINSEKNKIPNFWHNQEGKKGGSYSTEY